MKTLQSFNEIYKYGLKPNCPAEIDINVFNEWVSEQKIIFQQENDGNFLVATIIDESPDEVIYTFMRFFTLGNTTHCSIDFQSDNQKQMIQKLTQMLAKHHTF